MRVNYKFESAIRGVRYLYFKKSGLFDLLKWIMLSFFRVDYGTIDNKYNPLFFGSIRVTNRADLVKMQGDFYKSIEPSALHLKPKIIINWFFVFDWVLWMMYFLRNKDDFIVAPKSIIDKAAVFFSGYFLYASVRRLPYTSRNVYVFCDSVGLDAAIAYFYKMIGVSVTCIQHGQYRYEPSVLNSDIVPFVNNCGTEIIVWGEVTLAEYVRSGVGEKYKITVGGKFGYKKTSEIVCEDINFVCLVLNGPDTAGVNIGLIKFGCDFASKIGVDVYVRLHPADRSKYSMPKYSEDMEASTIFICHSSGFIVDSILRRRRILVCDDGCLPSIYRDLPVTVKDVLSATQVLDWYSRPGWIDCFSVISRRFILNV